VVWLIEGKILKKAAEIKNGTKIWPESFTRTQGKELLDQIQV